MQATAPLFDEITSRLRAAGCVYAEEEARLLMDASASPHALASQVQRRVNGEPLELVLGWAAFCGERIGVDAGVFIPRRRSEFLARQAIRMAPPGATVLDLCCGTGALGAAIARAVKGIHLHAADLDARAVRCARRNLAPWNGRVHEGDLYAPLPRSLLGRVDVLVVNAPYIPSDAIETLPREARMHEPRLSLDGGPDGHRMQQRVAEGALPWLASGGHLFMEASLSQAALAANLFRRAGMQVRTRRSKTWDSAVLIGSRAVA